MDRKLKVGIIGIGMVGAPFARFFKDVSGFVRGKDLFLYDIDQRKGYKDDPVQADIIFICVPTPRQDTGAVELGAVTMAITMIREPRTVVIKSTVPPGTTEQMQQNFPQHKFLFNPEFLTEAQAWENTLHPNKQLVGATEKGRSVASRVLALLPKAPLSAPSAKFNLSATETEIIKYASNIFLARKVTFANAIFEIAAYHGADYEQIRKGIAADQRIGPSHLDVQHNGYRGYGGYCFVKDTDALIAHCSTKGLRLVADLFAADRAFNEAVLASQRLTAGDVSVHDQEWVKKKLKREMQNRGGGNLSRKAVSFPATSVVHDV